MRSEGRSEIISLVLIELCTPWGCSKGNVLVLELEWGERACAWTESVDKGTDLQACV